MSALDRGLAYGDGVFRTFVARERVPQHWALHYAKLDGDCARLGIVAPPAQTLEQEVLKVADGKAECVVKIIVTRGAGARGYRYRTGTPTRIVATAALPEHPDAYRSEGVKVRICGLRLAAQPALAGIKHLNRLENVLARAEWNDPETAEGILCDHDGNAVGGTMTNIFAVRNGVLVTPALDRCGVAGVTRDRVMDAAKMLGMACHVRALPLAELYSSDEMFLVNSVVGVWPVRALGERSFAPGVVTQRIQTHLTSESDARVV